MTKAAPKTATPASEDWLRPAASIHILLILFLLSGCARVNLKDPAGSDADLRRYEFEEPQMGAPFRIVLYARSEHTAATAARMAFDRVAALNRVMSDYDDESELSRLSRRSGSGQPVPLSNDLWNILSQAQQWSRRTDGAFDVTVGPLVNLWRRARRVRQLPDPALLAEARQRVGSEKLILYPRQKAARLAVPDMRLDLGGIGKGFAVDAAMQIVREYGIRRALVAAVGDIAVSGPPPGKKGWRVEIVPLDTEGAPSAQYVLLKNAAISTSGDLAQRLEIDGKRYSHIVDPRTGVGLTDHSLVTIIARNCSTTDALDTAVSLLGPEKGLKLIQQTRGAEGRIVRKPEDVVEVHETKLFHRYLDTEHPR